MIIFIICLLIAIFAHEFAHLFVALMYGVKVKVFSVGFWKPYLKKTIGGIEFRLTPFILGGYCDLKGMDSREEEDCFLSKKYYQKFLILVAGVTVNFIIAIVCYLINYNDISLGIAIDVGLIQATFTNDYSQVYSIIPHNANIFLSQLSFINLFCAIGNIVPLIPLDGGLLFYYLFYDKMSKKVRKVIMTVGWVLAIVIQVLIVYYLWIIN